MQDVSEVFRVGQVDDAELSHILSMRLGQATYPSERRVDMPNGDNPRISLHYDKRGVLSRVDSGLDQMEVDEIVAEIKVKLLAATVDKVSRTVLFARSPTVGSWECDRFTLTAAPEEAPRPPWAIGAFPLVMETPFPATPDTYFNMERSRRLAHEDELLLSLFVPFLLTTPRYTSHLWAYVSRQDADPLRSEWVQAGYHIDGFDRFVDRRTPVAEAIRLVPDTQYYTRRGVSVGEQLDLPESLGRWIAKCAELEAGVQRQLLRSAYWLRHAHDVHSLSHSASLVATIQAVEVLLPKSAGAACSTCGLNTGPGPTARFAAFLEEHAPATDDDSARTRKDLYSLRSRLTHGHTLLVSDAEISVGGSGPRPMYEWLTLDRASSLARIAAINWFESLEF